MIPKRIPTGYHEEKRTWYPLLRSNWQLMLLATRRNPEWASWLSVLMMAYWPAIRYRVLVKDNP